MYTVSHKNWEPIKTDCKSDSGSTFSKSVMVPVAVSALGFTG